MVNHQYCTREIPENHRWSTWWFTSVWVCVLKNDVRNGVQADGSVHANNKKVR